MWEDSRRLFIFECKTKPEALILAKQFESKYNRRNKYSSGPEVATGSPSKLPEIEPIKDFSNSERLRRLSSIQKILKIVNYEPKQQINHALFKLSVYLFGFIHLSVILNESF